MHPPAPPFTQEPPPRSPARKLRAPLIAVGAALVALIATIVLINLGNRPQNAAPVADARNSDPGPASKSSAPDDSAARDQAAKINDLLELSKPSRGALRDALSQVLRCSKTGAAITSIEKVTDERGTQAERAKSLQVDALPEGEKLKNALVQALSASHRADAAYLKWAKRYESHDCSGKTVGDPDYDTGNTASEQATEAKSVFVELWNAVAEQEGLPTRTEDEI